ncbi:Serine-threonine/tyrosine-protein kinase, catalytic domain [Dillenia turbinata]|uniref:Serine-threonine/tyrosine-protein kinase, catalytic domain n=1 Tax=Dillenia turbinata TaxID=194707 RepID=A0AAN8Z5T1_9MAGN
MAQQIVSKPTEASFDFEILDNEMDYLRDVMATSNQGSPWIEPETLKLRHRIGRGRFGDLWLATHHQLTKAIEGPREVAVKMLHPLKKDDMKAVLSAFDNSFSKYKGLKGVCHLHGISILSGRVCIVMRFYEGSIGDRMVHLKGGKLSLPEVLRYGTDLAQGVMELHSKGILVLNLKPFNFLLNMNDQVTLGDIGIPYLLLGIALPISDAACGLGTPNYMAPEQWQPEIRGPISFETDSWGFGCSIVEMLTGVQTWCGRSAEEIYHLVVTRQEKPHIPSGLPPEVKKVLIGCFEYDFRSRPLMADILHAFKSSQNAAHGDGDWGGLGCKTIAYKFCNGYTEWFLAKDHLQVGDIVRSRKPPNSCKPENMDIPEGVIVGLDRDGFVLVRIHGIHDPLRVHRFSLERVTFGLAAGDWVRLNDVDKKQSPVGILHSVNRDESVAVGFIGVETLWKGGSSELQMAEPYCAGRFVRIRATVLNPRFIWPHKRGGTWATGRIWKILPNGCLVVRFPGRLSFGEENTSYLADPAEVEVVSFDTSPGMIKKYQHLEDFHWVVRPLLIALGLFTAIKVGLFAGKKSVQSKSRRNRRKTILK